MESIYKEVHPSSNPYFLARPSSRSPSAFEVAPITEYQSFFANTPYTERLVGFIDPSPEPDNPGWPLRNLLTYLRVRGFIPVSDVARVRVLCWRDSELPVAGKPWKSRFGVVETPIDNSLPAAGDRPSAVGWEKNPQGKLGPRLADLAPMMDPKR